MGFGVGVTTLKLSRQPSSKSSRKHTGKVSSVLEELGTERRSKHPEMIDRSRSRLNTYEGMSRGQDMTAALEFAADEYSFIRRQRGGRGLRADAAIGFVVVVKPEDDVINSWPPDVREKFFRDSDKVMEEFFNPEYRISRAIHRDERAEHEHSVYYGFDDKGELCVENIINPRTWKRINEEYPVRMRELGWDVEDHEMYDPERAEQDEQYRQERIEKRKKYGRSSYRYGWEKDMEKIADATERVERDRQAVERDKDVVKLGRSKNKKDKEKNDEDRNALDREKAEFSAWRSAELARISRMEQENTEAIRRGRAAMADEMASGSVQNAPERVFTRNLPDISGIG